MNNTMEMLKKHKITAIVRRVAPEKIVPLAEALYEGGIRLIEVTYNQADPDCVKTTSDMIRRLCLHFGESMCIGAGTVLSLEQLYAAIKSGARFALAPNVDASVIEEAVRLGVAAIPGALTPTEIQYAWSLGAAAIKLFPAGELGLNYVKALRGPLNHIPLMAVGGIDENNLLSYLQTGMIGAGIGSNIVKHELIEQNRFDELTELARQYTSLLQ